MKKALYLAIAGILLIFLLLNIIGSQTISPLYFDLMKSQKAAVTFLQKIKPLADFNYYKDLFDSNIQKQFMNEENKQRLEIARLEETLQKNPYSRDVLYTLYLLYTRSGNFVKAQQYFNRAQEIDPNLK